MNFTAFFIRRPVFTLVLIFVMVIIGLLGLTDLPIRWIPQVNPPVVSIETVYPGANPRLVEREVTKVIEASLSGINGLDTMSSYSREGSSSIMLTFKLGHNMDTAVADIRNDLERVRQSLPKEAENPIVSKSDTDEQAILYISFSDNRRNELELSDFIDRYITPLFENLDGVSSVVIYGKRLSSLQVLLDPKKMAARHIMADEVVKRLQEQSIATPSGQIRGKDRYYSVITDTALQTTEQFNELILQNTHNQLTRLKDIAQVNILPENTDTSFQINGQPGIALGVIPQSMANPLTVEERIKAAFLKLKPTLPPSMQATIIYNKADYIRASMHSVYKSFFEAVLCVMVVIFLFLCSFRASFIPIITIPVCIITSFALLYILGFSINTITLMAFVLAIGLVVDDAIVILENINRRQEEGLSIQQAAISGSSEMVFPVIAMTLTLAAVYAPVAFTPGLLGLLFREFAFTLAGAVLISGIVALTLSPMMCAYLLKKNYYSEKHYHLVSRNMEIFKKYYQDFLGYVLTKRHWILLGLILMSGLAIGMYHFLPKELSPVEDRDEINVSIAAPHSASAIYTKQYTKQMEALYQTIPDITNYLSISFSPSHVYQILMLKPRKERLYDIEQMVNNLTLQAQKLPGVKINVYVPSSPLAQVAGSDEGDNLGLVLMTNNEYDKLQEVSQNLMNAIKKNTGFAHIENGLKWDSEQFLVTIDRNRSADLNVPLSNITNTLSTLIAGYHAGKMQDNNIYIKMNEEALADPNIFHDIYVTNNDGNVVALSGLLSVHSTTAPYVLRHHERLRANTLFLTLSPNFKLAEAINALTELAKENLPDDMRYTFVGEAKNFLESQGKTLFTFLLALIFIYLVLAAQFESFIDPLIILFTVPLAIVGALITLFLFGGSINIYSSLGMITLIGLITKHGILITTFANQLRDSSYSLQEAIIKASTLRLRPILMTTGAMVLGALPLALASGSGAEARQQIGLVITGGVLFGTVFSLIVVPVMYTYLATWKRVHHSELQTSNSLFP